MELILASGKSLVRDHPKVMYYTDLLEKKVIAGQKVAIIGSGGIGFDVATFLTHRNGSDTDIASFMETWGVDMEYNHRGGLKVGTTRIARATSISAQEINRKTRQHIRERRLAGSTRQIYRKKV
jgi:pyruvate/2-oxoglutarate dehydrogenase complex dihydrolipoamide dehydrogenase (E3) component